MSSPLARLRRKLFAGLAGALLALVLVIGYLWVTRPTSLPAVDRASLQAARQRWEAAGLADYEIDVVVQGPQPGTYHTVVRQGKVVQATLDGQSLGGQSPPATWSVPGMFRTIRYDLQLVGRDQPGVPRLEVRAMFDPQYGFPRRYRRLQWGSMQELRWQVSRFVPAADQSQGDSARQ